MPAKHLRIATYNVNGIKGRLPVLLRWLDERAPDIACLQEVWVAAWDGLAAIEDAVQRQLFPPSPFDPAAFAANAEVTAAARHADVR